MLGGDGTEVEAGNLEEGKGLVAENVCVTGRFRLSEVSASAGFVVVAVKGRKRDKIRFQDFHPPHPHF